MPATDRQSTAATGRRVPDLLAAARIPAVPMLVVVTVVLSIAASGFATASNLEVLVDGAAILAIFAIAQAIVVISGNFDLSSPALAALAGVIFASSTESGGDAGGLVVALVAVVLAGVLNGLLALRINSFIATLASAGLFNGVAWIISGGSGYFNIRADGWFDWLGQGSLGPISAAVVVSAAAAAAMLLLFYRTVWGRWLYAVGSNREAARLAGVPVVVATVSSYACAGLLAGVAGILAASRSDSVAPIATFGGISGNLFDILGAVFIGGVAVTGGIGTLYGPILGALLLAAVTNGMSLLGYQAPVQAVVRGAIVVGSAWLSIRIVKKATARLKERALQRDPRRLTVAEPEYKPAGRGLE